MSVLFPIAGSRAAYLDRHRDPGTGKIDERLVELTGIGEVYLFFSTVLFLLFAWTDGWPVAILCLPMSLAGATYLRKASDLQAIMRFAAQPALERARAAKAPTRSSRIERGGAMMDELSEIAERGAQVALRRFIGEVSQRLAATETLQQQHRDANRRIEAAACAIRAQALFEARAIFEGKALPAMRAYIRDSVPVYWEPDTPPAPNPRKQGAEG